MINDELDVIGLDGPEAEVVEDTGVEEVELASPHPQYIFSNEDNPILDTLLNMFYTAVRGANVGIMQAKYEDGDEQHLLLVGLTTREGATACMPLARIITNEESLKYSSPDGNGGWIEATPVGLDDVGPAAE